MIKSVQLSTIQCIAMGAAAGLIGDYILDYTMLTLVDGIPGHLINALIAVLILFLNVSQLKKAD